jgi:phosphotriesterase-related protein
MNERVFLLSLGLQVAYPGFGGWVAENEIPPAQEQLRKLKSMGTDTIVDLSTLDTGREINALLAATEDTGLQVIAATGLHELVAPLNHLGPFGSRAGPEPLDTLFMYDINDGIQGTGIKAGVLTCSTDEAQLTTNGERLLRAVARVHFRTGVPIIALANPANQSGLIQQQLFAEEGIDPERVIIGHSGDTTDLDYLERLIGAGHLVGMDRFGLPDSMGPTLDERCRTVAELIWKGYVDRIVLSHETNVFSDSIPQQLRDDLDAANPDGYEFIARSVMARLRELGITQSQIDQMLIENPKKFFSS